MEIPQSLVDDTRNGRVVLVLGAGASFGATDADGGSPPGGRELARLLADRFLGGGYEDEALDFVADLAISESDLTTVQEFIRERYQGFSPAAFHQILPTFRWRTIATTNYDLVIERAYERVKQRTQDLVPFRSDRDRVDELLRGGDYLPYLKLHGCITNTTSSADRLILTPEQFVRHRESRHRLFQMLEERAYECPFVFVGHRLADFDLRQLIQTLQDRVESRPRWFLIRPDISPPEAQMWAKLSITCYANTFEDFLRGMDDALPSPLRGVKRSRVDESPVFARFAKQPTQLDESTLAFLTTDADYVHSSLPVSSTQPSAFYKGFDIGWSAVLNNLDVRRRVVETILSECLLPDEAERSTKQQLFVLTAEAGAGKTVAMRRVAWEAATSLDRFCIFVRPPGRISYSAIADLARSTAERIYLFVDGAADHTSGIAEALERARTDNLRLTIITAERLNEWNIHCARLESYVTDKYALHYLTTRELGELVDRLAFHKSLGQLAGRTREEQVADLTERAGRQLLVALHEATLGRPFEEIIADEFDGIEPAEAQLLYLSVCSLNRLGIPVRAGLISRVHGIPFEEFELRLFKPLEHVVETKKDPVLQEMVYRARHPLIAEMVFRHALSDRVKRFDLYIRLLKGLNILYSSDREAYRHMVRGRSILELFPDHSEALAIYHAAFEIADDDAYLLQQRGLYEMHRPDANYSEASRYLAEAQKLAPRDSSIVHSQAELARRRSEVSSLAIERTRFRHEARQLANRVREEWNGGAAAYHTLIKTSIDGLRETLSSDAPGTEIELAVDAAERDLERALQRHPNDPMLLSDEAELSSVLGDQERATRALRESFKRNPRSPFIANRLAKVLVHRGAGAEAEAVLREALAANSADHALHYGLAMQLLQREGPDADELIYHLRRSFSDGDSNLDAQFWYGVWLVSRGRDDDKAAASVVWTSLRSAGMPHDRRTEIRWFIPTPVNKQTFTGRLVRKDSTYGFIERDGMADQIFVHQDHAGSEWEGLRRTDRVRFNVGFNMSGPIALNVSVER